MQFQLLLIFVLVITGAEGARQRLVAFLGGIPLDGYEAEPIHHSLVAIEHVAIRWQSRG